jgi:hypothetical protein
MIHSYTIKNKKCYHYYVCLNAQQRGWSSCPTKSINAEAIEKAVVDYIRGVGWNREVTAAISTHEQDLGHALSVFGSGWESLEPDEQRRMIRVILNRVSYNGHDGKVTVTLSPSRIETLCMDSVLFEQGEYNNEGSHVQ